MNPRKKKILSIFMLVLFSGSILGIAVQVLMRPRGDKVANPIVVMETTMGVIEIELYPAEAPTTVENFLRYVEAGFYDGLCFHRVIDGFVIQGGGFTPEGVFKTPSNPIKIESNNGLSNTNGTIAMARASDPNSATSQFYINVADNTGLDYVDEKNPGYTVFGKVIKGMDTVMKISRVQTGTHEVYYPEFDYRATLDGWPMEDIVIIKAYVKE